MQVLEILSITVLGTLLAACGAGSTPGTAKMSVSLVDAPSSAYLEVNVDVQAGTTADVFIDFDAHKSVFVHEAGASGKYIMRPTVRAFDRMVTGSISGTLTVAGSLAPLPNAVVTAQTVGTAGPSVARSTTTNAAGHYVLDLLPRDFTYYVDSQPVLYDLTAAPTASYGPKASGPLAISATTPTAIFDAAFSLASATGAVTGAITPAAILPQVDMVQARLPLPAGSSTQTLIVRTVPATVTASGESYALQVLPVAMPDTTYSLVVERQSLDVSGNDVVQLGGITDVVLTPGATATANLTAP